VNPDQFVVLPRSLAIIIFLLQLIALIKDGQESKNKLFSIYLGNIDRYIGKLSKYFHFVISPITHLQLIPSFFSHCAGQPQAFPFPLCCLLSVVCSWHICTPRHAINLRYNIQISFTCTYVSPFVYNNCISMPFATGIVCG